MNIDPYDLSVAQQAALREMTQKLTERIDIVFIFCFALQKHESQHVHCFAEKHSNRWFQADMVLIYSDEEVRCKHDIQHLANNHNTPEHRYSSVIFQHSEANKLLTENDPFLSTVFREGALLYRNGQAQPKWKGFVCHETLLQQTRDGWRRWFSNSCHFMDCAAYCLVERNFSMAVFMIHQVVEQACKALLKVLLHMRPNTHNLAWMLKLCSSIAPEIASVFPRDNPMEMHLFKLLNKSYNDCRYAATFEVKEEEAWTLYYRAATLQKIAGERCNLKIKEMEEYLKMT